MTISKQAKEMSRDNGLEEDINQAYIELVGADSATAEDCQEAYSGEFKSDEDFAQDMAEQLGAIEADAKWPHNCIDWEYAARELMMDYSEQDGYYFRNL